MTDVNTVPTYKDLTPEELLNYTKNIRLGLIKDLTPEGLLPNNPDDRNAVLVLVESLDKQILAQERLRIDSKNADTSDRVANFISQLHGAGATDIHRTDKPVERDVTPNLDAIEIDDNLPDELYSQEPGAGSTNFNEFNTEFKSKNPEYQSDS